MRFLAGWTITADRLNDNSLETSTTSGAVAATDWSVSSFSGRKVNGITTAVLLVNRTGADITQTNTNITDVTMCTLPAGWRPPEVISIGWGNGSVVGEGTIGTSGLVTLRASSYTIASGTSVRVAAAWISEND